MKKQTIREQFEDIIRNKMTDKEFNAWAVGWLDAEDIIDQALEWDDETMKETIDEFNKNKISKKQSPIMRLERFNLIS